MSSSMHGNKIGLGVSVDHGKGGLLAAAIRILQAARPCL